MFRNDFLWLVPALLIAIGEIVVWINLPKAKKDEVEIEGEYEDIDKIRWDINVFFLLTLFWLQLVFKPLPISTNNVFLVPIRMFGYLFISVGCLLAIISLKTLGLNWTGLVEYRIKKKQKLITHGPYSLIRHPIYSGVLIQILGFELVANSFLFVPIILFGFIYIQKHIKLEEKLLLKHFGNSFKIYKKKTKSLIPYLL